MAIIYPSQDGLVTAATNDWPTLMNSDSAKTHNGTSDSLRGFEVRNITNSTYVKGETYYEFNTAGITTEMLSATFKIYAHHISTFNHPQGILVKGTFTDEGNSGYYNQFDVDTPCSSTLEFEVGWNSIPLNSVAMSQMKSSSTLKMFLINDWVFEEAAPELNTHYYADVYHSEHATLKPYIDYNLVPIITSNGSITLQNGRIELTQGHISL
jgi:hypothetical protein